jgi:hypothetical protein
MTEGTSLAIKPANAKCKMMERNEATCFTCVESNKKRGAEINFSSLLNVGGFFWGSGRFPQPVSGVQVQTKVQRLAANNSLSQTIRKIVP